MYNTIMFDLDGTLTDPKEGITKCVQYALKKMGIHEDNLDNLLPFIGPPLVDAFMKFYSMSYEDAHKALAFYRERFTDVGMFENKVINGIPEMLKALTASEKILLVATSKPRVYAEKILKHFDLAKYFKIISGPELNETTNTKDEIIAGLLKKYSLNPVMVGDRRQDVVAAHTCGIPCIGVRFGYAEENELEAANADKIVSSADELLQVLNN